MATTRAAGSRSRRSLPSLREHLPPGDPLAAYAARLEDPALRSSVRGFLTGSIDLVARISGRPAPRFVLADYKTNWLAAPDEELTLGHYTPAALASEMSRAHYGLQALLYTVALHRYLRWRQPGYDPDEHLAGVLLPVPARDGRRGHPGARRDAVRGVRVASPGCARPGLSDVLDEGGPSR